MVARPPHPPGYDFERHGVHNLVEPEVAVGPIPYLERLRELPPVYWDPAGGVWVCTGYAEAQAILRDGRRFPSVRLPEAAGGSARTAAVARFFGRQLLFLDGVEHMALRRLLEPRFGAAGVAAFEPQLRDIVRTALDRLPASGTFDLIGDFAAVLPRLLITRLLGASDADAPRLARYSAASNRLIGNLSLLRYLAGSEVGAALEEARGQLLDLLDPAAAPPPPSALDDLRRLVVDPPRPFSALPLEERLDLAASTALVVLSGGHQTLTHLVSRGVLLLHEHPDELQGARADPRRLAAAVDEAMRLEGPTTYVGRRVDVEATVGGQTLSPGQTVLLLLVAVNLDPDRYPDHRRFDPARSPTRHLGFAAGRHHCLGAPYATALAAIAIEGLLDRYPRLRPRAQPDAVSWGCHANVRCMTRALVEV